MQIISVGFQCYPAWLLRHMGRREASFPFDWLWSHPDMVTDCLNDNFETFLDPRHHVTIKPGHQSTHAIYTKLRRNDPTWNHHDILLPEHREHFVRSVNRMLDVVRSPEPTLFFALGGAWLMTDAAFARLASALSAAKPNSRLLAVRILDPNPEQRTMAFAQKSPSGLLHEFTPSSRMVGGLSFAEDADNVAIAEALSAAEAER